MTRHLSRDLEDLKRELLTMGAMVEEAISRAIAAYLRRKTDLAEQVIEGDARVDAKENQVEDMALKILALHQPVAADLRFVVMVLKVNHDLERMGDLASSMAERTLGLVAEPPLTISLPVEEMAEVVQRMVRRSLDALVDRDASAAREVLKEDDRVDELHKRMFELLQEVMRDDPTSIARSVRTLSMSRCLERLADHATNIAEDVVFMVEGETIRHRRRQLSLVREEG